MKALKLAGLGLLGIITLYSVVRAFFVTTSIVLSGVFTSDALGYWVGTLALCVWGFLKLLKNVRSSR